MKKSFGTLEVLKDISIDVYKGDVVSILGPSGSGKTTLLRCVNFLERADYGSISLDDKTIDLKTATKEQASEIQRKTGFVFQNYNLFRNKTALENITLGLTIQIGDRQSFFLRPYANDYNFCIEEAQNDQRRDARPELKSYPDSIASYDDIYLGFPNYWGTMPMPVFTFLQHFDFSGKTIHPFCPHEGSGLGRSLSDIQRLCPKALIAPALAISGTHASQSSPQVHRWLTQSLHALSASHSQHKTI